MSPIKYSLTFLSSLLLMPATAALEVGDTFCTEGFVMDFFCINRGTLLDRSDIVTLQGPEQHSLHCLLDVNSCTNTKSPYEVLIDPSEGETLHARGWRMTEASKKRMIDLGRSVGRVGRCTTCAGEGKLEKGFRAVFTATVLDLNLDDPFLPPSIDIAELKNSNSLGENPCGTAFSMTDVLETMNSTQRESLFSSRVDNSLRVKHLAHGSMMLIGWGFLLPAGIIIARFFKHRPNGLWFKIHRACQVTGLLFATVGWIIALTSFSVFGDKGLNNYRHGIMGMVTMIMGLLQPLNAFFRPHNPEEGETKSSRRLVWEIYHKGAGWATVLLAIGTVVLGTTILPNSNDSKAFLFAYIGCLSILLIGFVLIKRDQRVFQSESRRKEGQLGGNE